MAEQAIPPLVELGIKLVDFFRNKAEKRDAIQYLSRSEVGEDLSRPIGEMFGSLVRADAEIELYLKLLANAHGDFKKLLVEDYRLFFIPRIEGHLKSFMRILESIEQRRPEVNESIKGNACVSRDYYSDDLVRQLNVYRMKDESGTPFTAPIITDTLDAFKRVTDCYATGILAAIEDLPHAGRASK
jgi:hypothetical protein